MSKILIIGLIAFLLVLGGGQLRQGNVGEPAIAQFIQPEEFAPKVYELMPELPLENQYISTETGEVAPTNSLATRLIRYHLYVKNRSPLFRFDWKITLADYLGINGAMSGELYPGSSTLRENPLDKDREILRSLNRKQREELVDALVKIFNPNAARSSSTPASQPAAQPTSPDYNPPPLPQPGAADLLKLR